MEDYKFTCQHCLVNGIAYATNDASNWKKHCGTKKHRNKAAGKPTTQVLTCETCGYSTSHKATFENHLKSESHRFETEVMPLFPPAFQEHLRATRARGFEFSCPCCEMCRGSKGDFVQSDGTRFLRHVEACCQKASANAHSGREISQEELDLLGDLNTVLRICRSEKWSKHVKAKLRITELSMRRVCLALLLLVDEIKANEYDCQNQKLLDRVIGNNGVLRVLLPRSFERSGINLTYERKGMSAYEGADEDELDPEYLFPDDRSIFPRTTRVALLLRNANASASAR